MKKAILILALSVFLGLKAQTPLPNQVSIYPNPAVSSVNITFSEPVRSDVTITISDILGNKIETLKFSPEAVIHIDLSGMNLRNGMYLIKVETGDQSYLKRLVIKS